MTIDTSYIYTDASFSKLHNLGIIGYGVFNSTSQHNSMTLSELDLTILEIKETNNIRTELISAITALKSIKNKGNVVLYTDCQNIINLQRRREKLEKTNFISQSKNLPLANTDLYLEFYKIYDLIKPEVFWIKGHAPKLGADLIQRNFSFLDKAVRKKLREIISVSE